MHNEKRKSMYGIGIYSNDIIEDIKRVFTHANVDDSVMHYTLNLRDGGNGNIKM